MPIRMVDDPDNQGDYNEQNDNSGGGGRGSIGGGGGGGLLSFLPLILGLFGKGGGGGGKKIIFILIIAVAVFFFMGRGSCMSGLSDVVSNFATGGKLDPKEFKKASVYEGLEDDNSKNPLPESVSLLAYAPQRLNQGKQGSCVAWSSGYAAQTILNNVSTHTQGAQGTPFSPAFLYNYIGLDGCQGSYIIKAMEFMQQKGGVPFQQFPYDDNDCTTQASQALFNSAANNKIHGFNRLTDDDGVSSLNFRAIKEHLAKDAPVVIGMMVGGSFMQDMVGQKVWHPTQDDYTQQGFGGHAMCVIGYDDRIEGGAFQIMNSWGTDWGNNGTAYILYGDFRKFVREAYGIDALPKSGAALNVDFECTIGLVAADSKQYIPLRAGSSNTFATTVPVKKGTKFKIELKNALECYAYMFSMQEDNSSAVLFPYKPIHSPYFGVTGYRLFPRKESMYADSIGNKDFMAIVVSKQPLDYAAINAAINKSSQPTYAGKLNEAISSMAIGNVRFSSNSNGNIYFKADASEQKNVVGCVVEIDKQ